MTDRRSRASAASGIDDLLGRARRGSPRALGQLLNVYRGYLLAIARSGMAPELRGKAAPSDLVQETFLEAAAHFSQFKSDSDEALRAWLQALLLNNLADLKRRYRRAKRSVNRERRLEAGQIEGGPPLGLVDGRRTPADSAARRDDAAAIETALTRLPSQYRDVIVWRNKEGLPLSEVARRLNRSPDATRMLWMRALATLRGELKVRHERA